MTVLTDSLLKQVANIASNPTATFNNLNVGAQLGLGPRLANIDGSTPITFSPVVPIITHVPTMFSKIDGMSELLKTLVERHTKAISGIDFGVELEDTTAFMLADGQEAKIPTKAKRTAIAPNMTFAEVKGNLVWNFFKTWIYMINNPDTHASSLAAVADDMDPFVYSYFCMDVMFINFDETMLPGNIIDATFVTTMYPKLTGNIGAKREVSTIDGGIERSIDFNGILQHNTAVYNAAKSIAETLQLHKANFHYATPIATAIEANSQDMGLQAELFEVLSDFKTTNA